jgi:hypothetical protein
VQIIVTHVTNTILRDLPENRGASGQAYRKDKWRHDLLKSAKQNSDGMLATPIKYVLIHRYKLEFDMLTRFHSVWARVVVVQPPALWSYLLLKYIEFANLSWID